jgi:hypothetical protein
MLNIVLFTAISFGFNLGAVDSNHFFLLLILRYHILMISKSKRSYSKLIIEILLKLRLVQVVHILIKLM